MNFREQESAQKLAGAYYTPPAVAEFLVRWVGEIAPKTVLEPSCGHGVFIDALRNSSVASQKLSITAVDIDPEAIAFVRDGQPKCDAACNLHLVERDFVGHSLELMGSGIRFDAVVGNPPFIRYQYLSKAHQETAEAVFRSAELKFTRHTNAWVPFLIQGIRLLRGGGRLGMVIPSEIMHVLHAGAVRNFLMKSCSEIAVVHLDELFSDEVLQGVVLLLCTKQESEGANTSPAQIAFPTAKMSDLKNGHAASFIKGMPFISSRNLGYKWMEGLLTQDELEVYQAARECQKVCAFDELADVEVGIVTGANKFFLVSDEVVEKYGLEKFSLPMFGRSSHVRGISISEEDIANNARIGLPTNFIQFPSKPLEKLPTGARRYIALGENEGLSRRYKCRIRSPWYVVPSVWAANVAMLKRSHDVPRLILNEAGALTTDTAYRITVR
ncbi:N-6 DNA methylase, partial [Roseibium sp.]|uniref:N-6 DNA methylase n=1 Tax=Roseibium sp. TaxID=1936156 RepID=UPI00329A6875